MLAQTGSVVSNRLLLMLTVGKVLCVCAAMATVREVLAAEMSVAKDSGEITPLRLLGEWIDDPTEERFAWISAPIFDERQPSPDPDPNGVVSRGAI